MNLLSWILIILLAVWLAAALLYAHRHKGACGGSCAECQRRCKHRKDGPEA